MYCNICKEYKRIRLVTESSNNIVYTKCKCKITNKMSLSDFLLKSKESNHSHKSISYDYYCKDCECNFNDYEKHENHEIIDLEMYNSINIRKMKDNMTILDKLKVKKQKLIDFLKNQIRKVEESFEKCTMNNKDILEYLRILYKECKSNQYNYYLIENLIHNTHFNNPFENNSIFENVNECCKLFESFKLVKLPINSSKKILLLYSDSSKQLFKNTQRKTIINGMLMMNDSLIIASSESAIYLFSLLWFFNQKEVYVNQSITRLCKLSNNTFASIHNSFSSSFIIWSINNNQIKKLTEIQTQNYIYHIIPIRNNKVVYCTSEHQLVIFDILNDNDYNKKKIQLNHNNNVKAIIQLKFRDVIVTGGNNIVFLNSSDFTEIRVLYNQKCKENCFLEIDSQRLLVNCEEKILIVNTVNFQIESIIETKFDSNCFVKYNEEYVLLLTDKTINALNTIDYSIEIASFNLPTNNKDEIGLFNAKNKDDKEYLCVYNNYILYALGDYLYCIEIQ